VVSTVPSPLNVNEFPLIDPVLPISVMEVVPPPLEPSIPIFDIGVP